MLLIGKSNFTTKNSSLNFYAAEVQRAQSLISYFRLKSIAANTKVEEVIISTGNDFHTQTQTNLFIETLKNMP